MSDKGAFIDLQAMSSLVQCMDGAAEDLRGIKGELVSILGGVDLETSPPTPLETAAAWVSDQVPGLRRRLAMAQDIQGSNPKFGEGSPIPIDESKLSTLTPAQARQQAQNAATQLKGADGKPSAELINLIAKNKDDPYYAAAFAKQFSPTQLADIVKSMSNTWTGMHSPQPSDQEKAWNANYKRQVDALSGVLGTATRTTSPDLKMPPDWTQKWSDLITAKPTIDSKTGHSTYGDSLALSLLLKDGTYGTDFINKIANDAYSYERKEGANGDPVWAPKTGNGNDNVWDPDFDHQGPVNHDVMSNILKSLGHNPLASQEFFNGDQSETMKIHGKDVVVDSKLKYFLQDRTWSRDDLSDAGDGLGDAIRAATTYYRDRGYFGQNSADIASQTMAIIGDKEGDGAHGGHWYEFGGGASSGWHMPKGLQSDVADIMASYVPDLYRMYNNGDQTSDRIPPWVQTGTDQYAPGDPYGMSINKDDLSKIMQTLGTNKDNITKISTSVLAYNQYELGQVFDTIKDPQTKVNILKGQDWPPLTAAMQRGPNVLQNMFHDAYTGDDAAEKIKNANTEALNKFIDVAGDFPATDLLKISNPVAGWAFDTIKGEALDHLKGDPVDDAAKLYTDAANKQTQSLTHNFQNVMLQHGFYDPSVIKLLKDQATKDGGYTAPPTGALRYDSNHHVIGFNFQSQAYQNWANGIHDADHPSNGTMPGGQLSEAVKQIYVTDFGVKF